MALFNRRSDADTPAPPGSANGTPVESSVVANLGAAVALISADDGKIVYTNDRWDLMFGYDRDELVGRHVSVVNAATHETPEARAQQISDALARDGVWSGEVHNVRKDGSSFWTAANVSRFDHPDHGTVWLSVSSDVTERRAAEARLRESEQTYRRAFESSPAALALLGSDLRLTLANQAFADVLGYRRDQIEGASLPDLTHPEDIPRCVALRTEVLNGDQPGYRLEERLRGPSGGWMPVVLTGTVVRGNDGAPQADILTVERLKGESP
jgi:PAS domain S-box-containing protein